MPCGTSGSKYDLSGNKIQDTYGRLVQIIPSASSANQNKTLTPNLYDGYGNPITGVKLQEAFERDSDGNVQPTLGPFFDWFWEEDEDGNKQPRDFKFWLDNELNVQVLPEDKSNVTAEPYTGTVTNSAFDFKRTFISSNYSVNIKDHLIGVDTQNGEIILSLPSASLGNQSYIIKDEGYNVSNKNVILKSVDPNDRFENNKTDITLTTNGTSITVYSDGSNKYYII